MPWTLCLFPQSRRDPSDPVPSLSFEKRLQEIITIFAAADALADATPQIKQADRLIAHLLQAISGNFSMVGQPSSRQLTRFWFLCGEIKLALGEHQSALDAMECCAGLVAQNPARDHIAVDYMRARIAGHLSRYRKSMEHCAAIIERLDLLQPDDFADGDLRGFRCYVYLQRAQRYMALGYFDNAQTDMYVATSILDDALTLGGAPRRHDDIRDGNRHMHPAFADYANRLRGVITDTTPAMSMSRNWLDLCFEVPATYATVEMWHTRLAMRERSANGLLDSFYQLLIACAGVSMQLPTWSATTTLLYYRAAEIAIVGYDLVYILPEYTAAGERDECKRAWLRRADQALVNVFGEQGHDAGAPSEDAALRIALDRYGLWLRQRFSHLSDLPYVPDLIEIGTGVRQLLHEAITEGKTWIAASCSHLLGYVAMALGDLSDADCCLHDALAIFEQAHGDIFYPSYEEIRRAIAQLKRD